MTISPTALVRSYPPRNEEDSMKTRLSTFTNVAALLACGLLFSVAFVTPRSESSQTVMPEAAGSVDQSAAPTDDGTEACQRCGDGVCARSCENERSCPQDCGGTTSECDVIDDDEACQRCGDGYCAKSCENARTCPEDCGTST
jgi:hypothetical protein